MPRTIVEPGVDVIEMARRLHPNMSTAEVRRGVVRVQIEMSIEQKARGLIAARARGMGLARLVRIVFQDYLDKHTTMPDFLPPPNIGVGAHAWQSGHRKIRDQGPTADDPFKEVVALPQKRLAP